MGMSLRSQLSAVRREALCTLHRRTASLGDRGPFVSFSFDDFPRTAFTVGGSILRSHGARGTYYTALRLMDAETEVGQQFCRKDLFSLVQDGHELASHTLSHISSRATSCALFQQDVERGMQALLKEAGISAANFAYPFGHVTLRTKKALGSKTSSCRGTFAGINGPQLDLNLLRANSLYGSDEAIPAAHQLITENQNRRGWLIFYTHDVAADHSAYGCTPALLESVVSLALRSRSRVMTVNDVLTEIGAARSENESVAQREFPRPVRFEAASCR
jgi:peptidoglycan/xylan/chitin deacetylase (PgdA/CDA1 family)